MVNTFHPERLQDAVGVERCAFGMPFVQATLDGDGAFKAVIGAGLSAAVEHDMPLWLRCHVPPCVAFESVSVAGERRGGEASWREAIGLARGLHASFDLIRCLGYGVYPSAKKRIAGTSIRVVADMLWFVSRIRVFREVLVTGKAECQALVVMKNARSPSAIWHRISKPRMRTRERRSS